MDHEKLKTGGIPNVKIIMMAVIMMMRMATTIEGKTVAITVTKTMAVRRRRRRRMSGFHGRVHDRL